MAAKKKSRKKGGKWLQKARESMQERGTVGKFGKATRSKIAAGKRAGGTRKKEAVFAENAKKAAMKRKKKGRTSSSGRR
jgi:hypothetical protein